MKKVPYGILNYKVLIEGNYLFVDKTMYLEKLESIDDLVYLHAQELLAKVYLRV